MDKGLKYPMKGLVCCLVKVEDIWKSCKEDFGFGGSNVESALGGEVVGKVDVEKPVVVRVD